MNNCDYIYKYVMMKPPFKASDSFINVLHSPWFDTCTLWFVVSLSCINTNLKSWLCHAHLCNIRPIINLALGLVALGLGDYKPDIALVA